MIIIKQNKRVVWWCGVGKAGGGGFGDALIRRRSEVPWNKLKLETKDLYTSTKNQKN